MTEQTLGKNKTSFVRPLTLSSPNDIFIFFFTSRSYLSPHNNLSDMKQDCQVKKIKRPNLAKSSVKKAKSSKLKRSQIKADFSKKQDKQT